MRYADDNIDDHSQFQEGAIFICAYFNEFIILVLFLVIYLVELLHFVFTEQTFVTVKAPLVVWSFHAPNPPSPCVEWTHSLNWSLVGVWDIF
jgi:hypothetical protein